MSWFGVIITGAAGGLMALIIWSTLVSAGKEHKCTEAGGVPVQTHSGFICLAKDAVLHPIYKGDSK